MAQPATLVVLLGAAAVLAIMGPFGTDRLLGLVPRALYWLAICFPTYAAGVMISVLLEPRLTRWPEPLAVALQALGIGCAVSALVLLVNAVTFGWRPSGTEWPTFLGTIFAIALIVTIVLHIARRHSAPPAAAQDPQKAPQKAPHLAPPPLLDRLPFDKRGALVALSVEDHYVRVRTSKGEDLVLMRLSDAIREVGDTAGAQVHRSHWVAWDQIRAARREKDRAILTVTGGHDIPVSRANLPVIKEAGLLPR